MSDTAPIDDMLQRVEQMLDALEVSNQSSSDFLKDGCDQLERYLYDQKNPCWRAARYQNRKQIVLRSLLNGWLGWQKRAETGPIFRLVYKNILPNSRIE